MSSTSPFQLRLGTRNESYQDEAALISLRQQCFEFTQSHLKVHPFSKSFGQQKRLQQGFEELKSSLFMVSATLCDAKRQALPASEQPQRLLFPLENLLLLGGLGSFKKVLTELNQRKSGINSSWVAVACERIFNTAFHGSSALSRNGAHSAANPKLEEQHINSLSATLGFTKRFSHDFYIGRTARQELGLPDLNQNDGMIFQVNFPIEAHLLPLFEEVIQACFGAPIFTLSASYQNSLLLTAQDALGAYREQQELQWSLHQNTLKPTTQTLHSPDEALTNPDATSSARSDLEGAPKRSKMAL